MRRTGTGESVFPCTVQSKPSRPAHRPAAESGVDPGPRPSLMPGECASSVPASVRYGPEDPGRSRRRSPGKAASTPPRTPARTSGGCGHDCLGSATSSDSSPPSARRGGRARRRPCVPRYPPDTAGRCRQGLRGDHRAPPGRGTGIGETPRLRDALAPEMQVGNGPEEIAHVLQRSWPSGHDCAAVTGTEHERHSAQRPSSRSLQPTFRAGGRGTVSSHLRGCSLGGDHHHIRRSIPMKGANIGGENTETSSELGLSGSFSLKHSP